MCGRFSLLATAKEIMVHFQLAGGFSMVPRYNIAPTTMIPMIGAPGRQVDFMRWGLIAPWVKSVKGKSPIGCINLRQETLAENLTFKKIFATQRCIIPASGYFEWKTLQGKKQPFYIQLSQGKLMGFAGLWAKWQAADGNMIESCAIITTQANTQIAQVHERMPLVLVVKDYVSWLNVKAPFEMLKMLMSQPVGATFTIFPVTQRMNDPRYDVVACVNSL